MTHSTAPPSAPAVRGMLRLENASALDRLVDAYRPIAHAVTGTGTRRRLLQDGLVGHAIHPSLTHLPIGLWLSATVLDLGGGQQARPAARRLVGLGALGALPAVTTGMAEWTSVEQPGLQRVGVVHAAANAVALTLYTASWVARRGGRHGAGVGLGFVAGGALGLGSFLGGHLGTGRHVSSRDPAFADTGD